MIASRTLLRCGISRRSAALRRRAVLNRCLDLKQSHVHVQKFNDSIETLHKPFSSTSSDDTQKTPTQQTQEFLSSLGYSVAVSDGVIDALLQNGIQPSSLLSMVKALAGRYEVDEDGGLEALAASVKLELEKEEGKSKVKIWCLPSTGWSPAPEEDSTSPPIIDSMERAFQVEAMEGTTLTDVAKFGTSENCDVLGEYLECACAGIMACSTCHVVIHPDWYDDTISPPDDETLLSVRPRSKRDDSEDDKESSRSSHHDKIGPPSEAEQDMLDLAFEPQITSRLGKSVCLVRVHLYLKRGTFSHTPCLSSNTRLSNKIEQRT